MSCEIHVLSKLRRKLHRHWDSIYEAIRFRFEILELWRDCVWVTVAVSSHLTWLCVEYTVIRSISFFFNLKESNSDEFNILISIKQNKHFSSTENVYDMLWLLKKKLPGLLAIPLLWIRRMIKARCLVEVNSERYWKGEEKSASMHIFSV